MNQIVLLILVLAAGLWVAVSVETREWEFHGISKAVTAVHQQPVRSNDASGPGVVLRFDALHPGLLAALQLLVAVGALLAATPTSASTGRCDSESR